MAFGTPVIFLAAGPLMGLFSKDPTVVEVGTVYLRIEVFVFVAYVVIYVNNSALQGLQKPFFALWIGLLRQIAGPLLVFHLLAYRLGWGLLGIWWGIFLITWLAAGVSIYYTRRVVLTLCREAEAVLPSLDPNAV
jgi:Na+-driven multidrug efflux pump